MWKDKEGSGIPDQKNKGTFLIKVNSSESGTWQGNVLWADENKTEHFRSTLELLNLIDEAMGGVIGAQAGGEHTSFGKCSG